MRVALCFPFDNTAMDAAVAHLRESLARLAQQRPDFAGTLEVHRDGTLHLRIGQGEILLETVDISAEFPFASYDELSAAEFPPGAFVGPHFGHPCDLTEGKPGVPVTVVKAFIIPGGLLLGVYVCHAFADGDCLRIFLEAFSGQTRGQPYDGPSTKTLYAPFANGEPVDDCPNALDALLERVPEYVVLDEPIGPTVPRLRAGGVPMEDIQKTGKSFVFDNTRLVELRNQLMAAVEGTVNSKDGKRENGDGHAYNQNHTSSITNSTTNSKSNGHAAEDTSSGEIYQTPPSNYTCLAALTWAHVSRARLADPVRYVPFSAEADGTALLQTMVNWKSRAFTKANAGYFGNATAIAVTQLLSCGLVAEASDDLAKLAKLAYTIEKTIGGVDDGYVGDRTELFNRVSDPRRVGLNFDPRTPQDLGFNTWRFFGPDTQWVIPGVVSGGAAGPTAPDSIRRLQDAWHMSSAVIMPAKAASSVHELLITLPQTSMDVLCRDAGWMQWIDRVIG